jgi:hypothetical protein
MPVIPRGHIWVEGDNTANSTDSRDYGPLPLGLVKGRVLFRLWPPLPSINRAFAEKTRVKNGNTKWRNPKSSKSNSCDEMMTGATRNFSTYYFPRLLNSKRSTTLFFSSSLSGHILFNSFIFSPSALNFVTMTGLTKCKMPYKQSYCISGCHAIEGDRKLTSIYFSCPISVCSFEV